MDFIAFDFETANAKRDSAVSIALTVVRENKIVDEFYSLLNPNVEFNQQNIKINGIKASDVIDAPTFSELWPVIQPFFAPDKLVVAHNAAFDNSVLKASLIRNNLSVPQFQSLDTVKVTRNLIPKLENHKLDTVARHFDIPLVHHHNALDDSLAAANILLATIDKFGVENVTTFIKAV